MAGEIISATTKSGHSDKLPPRWDDIDHAIYEHRIRQHKTWRDVGEAVGMDYSAARRRFYRRMAAVTPAEVTEMRAEENLRLDDLEDKLMQAAVAAGKAGELDSMLRALREAHNVHRSRAQLNGINAPVPTEVTITVDDARREVDELLGAFLTGAADASVTDRAPS